MSPSTGNIKTQPRGRPAPDGQKLKIPPTRDSFDFRKSLLAFAMPLAKLAGMTANVRKRLSVEVVVVRVRDVAGRKGKEAREEGDQVDSAVLGGLKGGENDKVANGGQASTKGEAMAEDKEAEVVESGGSTNDTDVLSDNAGAKDGQGRQPSTAGETMDRLREAEGLVIRRVPTIDNDAHPRPTSNEMPPEDEWTFPSTDCLIGTDRTLLETVQRCAKEQLGVDISLVQSLLGINTFGKMPADATHVRFVFLVKVHPTEWDEQGTELRGGGEEETRGTEKETTMETGETAEKGEKGEKGEMRSNVREGYEMKWVSQEEVWKTLIREGAMCKVGLRSASEEAAEGGRKEMRDHEGKGQGQGAVGNSGQGGSGNGSGNGVVRANRDSEGRVLAGNSEREEQGEEEKRGEVPEVPEVMSNVGHAGL